MGFEVNNPFLYQLREGSIADPFVDKVESLTVVSGRLLLTEMPVKQNGVVIDGHTEIDVNTPTGTQFYVDYTNGTVYFVSTKNAVVTARYKGRGLVQIPSERVYHKKGSVTRTLDTIVETVDTSAIAASNAASLANAKATAADNAATAANTQSTYAKDQGDYAKAQGNYAATATSNANTATNVANNATNAASAATTQANAARDAANTAATNANAKATLAEQKANAVDVVATKADTNANFATAQGTYAKEQGDYAKAQGLIAKDQADYAKFQGDRVDTRLAQTNTAEQNAVTATTNAVAATQGVLNSISVVTNQGTQASQSAAQATSQADYAKTQGDYAKAQGDAAKAAVVGTITNKAVTSAKLDDDVQVGSLKTLKTDVKTSVTGALNEIFEDVTKSILGGKMTSTTLANFVGKIAGSMTANPHIQKSGYSSTLLTPSAGAFFEGSQADYNGLSILDGVNRVNIRSVSSEQSQQLFSFNLIEQIQRQYGITLSGTTADKVTWLKANLSKLTFNWHGYGSSATGSKATVAGWRDGSSWITFGTSTSASVNKVSLALTTNSGQYIDSNGFYHTLAYAEPSDGVTPSIINTDYVELNVELSADLWNAAKPQWVNATLQNSWVEFDATQTPKYELGKDGFVELIGAVKSGTLGSAMMTLPSGYRPIKQFTGLSSGNDGNIYRIAISTSGVVTVTQSVGSSGNAFVSLDGVRFPVA